MKEDKANQKNRAYDLEERLSKFAEKIVDLVKRVPKNTVTIPILNQLIKSGTSIGANYCEANGASSKRDFKNKIHICNKESRETKLWLRLLANAHGPVKDECRDLWKEAHEYNLIFSKAISTMNKKEKIRLNSIKK